MISIYHILIYLFNNGSLPWKPLIAEDVDPKDILKTKRVTTSKELCFALPDCLIDFVKYV